MAAKLKSLGFDVITSFNASRQNLGRAIGRFSAKLSAGGTGLVFYAGHGVQANGRNYLIPVNAELEDENDLKYGAIDTQNILEAMRDAGNPLNILIIDACRDNPLPKRSRSSSRGLAISSVPQGAKGTAIIYAAGPGQTAADGTDGGNGIFTGALLKHIGKPGWTLQKVLQATSQEVLQRTNNKQRPWQLVSMQGEFRFKEAAKINVVQPRQTVGSNNQAEIVFWQSIKDSNDLSVYQAYLTQYPSGSFSTLARIKIAKLEQASAQKAISQAKKDREAMRKKNAAADRSRQWAGLKDSKDVGSLSAFIKQHSGSPEADKARHKLAMLTKEEQRLSAEKKRLEQARLQLEKSKSSRSNTSSALSIQVLDAKVDGDWRGETEVCGETPNGHPARYVLEMSIKDLIYSATIHLVHSDGTNVQGTDKGQLTTKFQQTILVNRFELRMKFDAKTDQFTGNLQNEPDQLGVICPITLTRD